MPLRLHAFPLLLASALVPAALAAQAPSPAGVQARDPRSIGAPALGLVTRVRFALTDTTVQLTRPRPVGSNNRLEGKLVSYDGEFAVLDLPRGYQFTIPVSSLTEIEQRVGPGPCRRTVGAHALCTLAIVGGGMAVGWVAGERIGHTVANVATGDDNPYAQRGALLGTVIGIAMLPTIGRDEWVRVPMPLQP